MGAGDAQRLGHADKLRAVPMQGLGNLAALAFVNRLAQCWSFHLRHNSEAVSILSMMQLWKQLDTQQQPN